LRGEAANETDDAWKMDRRQQEAPMGVTEEAGKTITGVAESMKSSPSCIAAILLAAMFSALSYASLRNERTDMQERQMALIERCSFLAPHNEPPFQRNSN
jgi:hypothetical protein